MVCRRPLVQAVRFRAMLAPCYSPCGDSTAARASRTPTASKPSGANALWFHGFDADAFEACARADLAPCVEVKTFRADFDKRPDLVPVGVDGKPIRYGRLVQGVCLSRAYFMEEIETSLGSGLRLLLARRACGSTT